MNVVREGGGVGLPSRSTRALPPRRPCAKPLHRTSPSRLPTPHSTHATPNPHTHITGTSEAAGGLGFWRNVYGFDMSPIAGAIAEAGRGQAVVLDIDRKHVRTTTARVRQLDMCTMKPEDQDFTSEFTLELLPPVAGAEAEAGAAGVEAAEAGAGQQGQGEVGCIVLWFDTEFSGRHCQQHPVRLSTSPFEPTTHWVQTLLTLRK